VDHSDTLLTIAELGIALAGFATLATAIARRQDGQTPALGLSLILMLEVALRNVGFAVLPLPFLASFSSDPNLWRVGSGLYVVTVWAHGYFRLRSGSMWFGISNWVLIAITSLVAIANIFGLAGSNAFSLYIANLLLGLGASGLTFISVAKGVLRVERA
jgi:hypothetical protein